MFFLGGMTMGYLHPPAKTDREAPVSTSIPAEKDRRLLETPEAPAKIRRGSGEDRSLLWAWRTLV
ncbi:hypothetical protein ATY81_07000 [Rhizobium sp. R72]|uniref:hypothetical protein n=1 Tax=unclassified Rhizobium TaxID=2613769 RepID=UPI000B52CF6B|nr:MULTISPECIES: hypothetical protein [unclassified Rhizobium]OWW00976.1 hypothetical protein ATY81_07000 [Rhizobium sp. R72]OWW01355.1 hypothetical protein ATY80_07000 [Rhizobium sp. R711]